MAKTSVRVRMYHVGFGDCFLLTLPGPRYVLVDCGVHPQGDLHAMADVVQDIIAVTGNHVHLVVCTHRHTDHISGFGKEAARFNQLHVDEVWLPWTEDPNDPAAVQLRKQHDLLAHALEAANPQLAPFALNNATNQDAMTVLLSGFAQQPRRRFLSADSGEITTAVLPGIQVHVLGPPRSEEYLKQMDPPNKDSYLALLSGGDGGRDHGPFPAHWHLAPQVARQLFAAELKGRPLLKTSGNLSEDLAFALDQAINNTSVVLLLRVGKARLLLPGDAQWGNWLSFLENSDITAELKAVDFYKVSHHGSHNGTPRRAVDAMGKLKSMVSTQSQPWPSIPQLPLLTALQQHGPVVRSDKGTVAAGFTKGKFWIDLDLPC